MQVIGKKMSLQGRWVAKNSKALPMSQRYDQQQELNQSYADLFKLPVEILYRIFDYLTAQTITLSLRYVCRRLRAIVEKYYRYSLDFEDIAMVTMWQMCRSIQPETVVSLKLSDGARTPQQIEYFLSLVDISKFN
ncbi:unnamed protein product [Rotaria sp. Silwood2]|nr:unnamed protein product [Rotaria sp. Silwood2]CAF4439377.1 unnamed protein product [Rotaria sp. Silwood2]